MIVSNDGSVSTRGETAQNLGVDLKILCVKKLIKTLIFSERKFNQDLSQNFDTREKKK